MENQEGMKKTLTSIHQAHSVIIRAMTKLLKNSSDIQVPAKCTFGIKRDEEYVGNSKRRHIH
ncbi:hypothetical protein COLO4_33715 [Corchorus olitorius]|uniref:Uncharacterized protein n=1 Tax=Corchorus olitorius TaxID=93759 RepID=A0A1R3GS53_9ROSI|nr:hypothetical protein COLO4_33715 [Corchorus olitorius]